MMGFDIFLGIVAISVLIAGIFLLSISKGNTVKKLIGIILTIVGAIFSFAFIFALFRLGFGAG
ncbi:hypothetical protein COY26_04430 [Candidatus Woesearchaeota archaeon CG_4_10_14_0_2_um_filter_33_10]|nr:MAG: hypothetical protein COV14_02400 [Candidatus Woesearchaeota archaeon CG10_big_fil_rev_8_21_14_0_10_33_12]PIZ52548.1 MAG: hypothetical protein COY26_04430 [Candidatus Woesearchaeota archaeon CG_4_10_14_0_2_um_filter_33_10]